MNTETLRTFIAAAQIKNFILFSIVIIYFVVQEPF